MKRIIQAAIYLLLLFTTSCKPGQTTPGPTDQNVTVTSAPTITQQEIVPTEITPTIPTTLTPSPGLSPYPSQTFTITPTSAPTMTVDEMQTEISKLLQTNGNCKESCFWGVEVNKTTFNEVDQFFKSLRRKGLYSPNSDGGIGEYSTGFETNSSAPISVDIAFAFKVGVVDKIEVYIGGGPLSENDPSIWQAYSIKKMLQVYGVPTKVFLSIGRPHEPNMGSGVTYGLFIFWERYNTGVFYQGGKINDGQMYYFCPGNMGNSGIQYLQLFINNESMKTFVAGTKIEEASAMTVEDFYNRFTRGDSKTCLAAKASAFK